MSSWCEACGEWIAPTITRQQHELTTTHRKRAGVPPRDASRQDDSGRLDAAWREAEAAARKFGSSASGYPYGVRLLGPYPMVGRPTTYQAELWDADGRKHEPIGLANTPDGALAALTAQIATGGVRAR